MENMKKKEKLNGRENMQKKREKINRRREKLNARREENMKIKKKKEDEEQQMKKKKEDEKLLLRPWNALPSLPLFNIIRNLPFKDRFESIPLVCKSWNSVISDDPRCWSSMIPDSISPDDAFIKKPVYSIQVIRDPGDSYLRNFIKKSTCSLGLGGGSSSSSSTITSLFLDPFHFSDSDTNDSIHQDEILHLIAQCCPNLKHISFDGFYCASREAVLEVIHRCKKIELIDFSDSRYADSVHVIEELGNCLPNLRGIRMAGWKDYSIHDAIATHLPRIKLLAVDFPSSDDEYIRKLTSETECCLYELQYLSVAVYCIINSPPPVCKHIPEFHFEEHCYNWSFIECVKCQPLPLHPGPVSRPRLGYRQPLCYSCYLIPQKKAREEAEKKVREEAEKKAREEAEEAYLEYYLEYYRYDEVYYSIMKQKKECEYYVSISKEKKKTRRNHPYIVLRTRMRNDKKEASFISKMKMRKKRDKHDYQDYYVQSLL